VWAPATNGKHLLRERRFRTGVADCVVAKAVAYVAAVTEHFIDTPETPTTDRNQVIAAIVLGIAAVLTALAAYNAALADGDALQGYTNSTRTLNDANFFYSQGNSKSSADQALFVEYATANFQAEEERAQYLLTLMRPELVAAVEWWESTDAAVTPFDEVDDNPYTVEDFTSAAELEEQARVEFDDGAAADDKGDVFELAAVFFALTLFFAGVATLFAKRSVTVALLGIGGVTIVVGAVNLVRAFGA